MRDKIIGFVVAVCMTSLIFSAASARGRPHGPGGSTAEAVVFAGDLAGFGILEDCCPNAGPYPEFTMTLSGILFGDPPQDTRTYDGQLFMNRYGTGQNQEYVVQFWNRAVALEIIGGVIDHDKRNKITTVTFTDEACFDLNTGEFLAEVSFVLVRSRQPN